MTRPVNPQQPDLETQAALDQLAEEIAAGRGALRLAALATVAGHEPQVRSVIIRRFSQAEWTLIFFCRADDAKFGEIASNPHVELVSYARHPDRQIRLAGTAATITSVVRQDELWAEVSALARRDYVLANPGETDARDHPATSGDGAAKEAAQRQADRETDAIISATRAPLFRAIEVSIRRVKLLTFEQDRWVQHGYLPHL